MKKSVRRKIPWIIMLVFMLVGLGFSIYLTVLHVKVFTQAGYAADSSVCSISEKVNCETVAENPYSVFMGAPVSIWGIFGNLLMLLGISLGIRHPRSKNVQLYMLGFTGFSIAISLLLGYISITKISSICIFCFGTYIINFTVFFLLLYVMFREKTNPFSQIPLFLRWSLQKLY
ncbi:hypothetical protein KJ865_14840, partial [Myxococcota bacterium]|nr:hypothetical protein [Myxococcota bacterium]